MDATGLRFALHYFHIISHSPPNLPRWQLEPYGLAALLEDAERRPMGWLLLSCHFRLSGRRHRYISLCSSLFRLLNYIPINNALPAYLPYPRRVYLPFHRRHRGRIFLLREAVKSSHLSSLLDSRSQRRDRFAILHFRRMNNIPVTNAASFSIDITITEMRSRPVKLRFNTVLS